jgi:hypothetical protein
VTKDIHQKVAQDGCASVQDTSIVRKSQRIKEREAKGIVRDWSGLQVTEKKDLPKNLR